MRKSLTKNNYPIPKNKLLIPIKPPHGGLIAVVSDALIHHYHFKEAMVNAKLLLDKLENYL